MKPETTPSAPPPARIGQSIMIWAQVLPLIQALRDIAQCSPDQEAQDVAVQALKNTFPGPDGLNMIFGRLKP